LQSQRAGSGESVVPSGILVRRRRRRRRLTKTESKAAKALCASGTVMTVGGWVIGYGSVEAMLPMTATGERGRPGGEGGGSYRGQIFGWPPSLFLVGGRHLQILRAAQHETDTRCTGS
jgi:hypothetical protein